MRCPLCGTPLHEKIAYILPENRVGLVPPNEQPFVCRKCFESNLGWPARARDLVANR